MCRWAATGKFFIAVLWTVFLYCQTVTTYKNVIWALSKSNIAGFNGAANGVRFFLKWGYHKPTLNHHFLFTSCGLVSRANISLAWKFCLLESKQKNHCLMLSLSHYSSSWKAVIFKWIILHVEKWKNCCSLISWVEELHLMCSFLVGLDSIF